MNIKNNKNRKTFDPNGNGLNPVTNEPYSERYIELARKWSVLPAYEKSIELVDSIKNNQVILISSGTGSGKTLMTPRYALEAFNFDPTVRIAITLPKQILTVSNATYQAEISDLVLGKHVGYTFRGSDKKYSKNNVTLLYATDGTIVSKLLRDPELREFNCVIIDEAHERKVQIDLLLYLLKHVCDSRNDFKLIIMSATIDDTLFRNYFSSFKFEYFNIGTKTNFPITSVFLKESLGSTEPSGGTKYIEKGFDIVEKLVNNSDQFNVTNGTTATNDILFFVTSIQETFDSCKKLSLLPSKNIDKLYCAEVYAGMNPETQQYAQDEILYKNKFGKTRKIVFATNVAESSLTISGIKYVIDSGLEIVGHYDPILKAKVLEKKFITHAQARQRMGRCGRTGPGTCYHLYTEKEFESMTKFPLPTIKTSNISGECLRLLNLPHTHSVDGLKNMLNNFIEPPDKIYVDDALSTLKRLGLITNNEITQLGKCVAELQVDPSQGVSLYVAYLLGCVKEVITIICVCDVIKNNISGLFVSAPIETPDNDNKKWQQKFDDAKNKLAVKNSDHLSLLKIFDKYIDLLENKPKKLDDWIFEHFLKKSVLEKIHSTVNKTKHNIMSQLKKYTDGHPRIYYDNHDTNTKILASFYAGYHINIGSGNGNNNDNKKTLPSKDSWINVANNSRGSSGTIIYNELFSMNNRLEILIVSKINSKSIQLFEAVNNGDKI